MRVCRHASVRVCRHASVTVCTCDYAGTCTVCRTCTVTGDARVVLPELDASAVLLLLLPADILQPTVELLDLPKQRCTVSRVQLV